MWINFGNSFANSILLNVLPLRPLTRCCIVPLIDTPEVFISPLLVPSQMLLRPVVSKDFKGAFGRDRKVLLAHMAPDHMWIVDWVSRTGSEWSSPAYISEELLAHGDCRLCLWGLLPWRVRFDLPLRVCSLTSDRVASWLLGSESWLLSSSPAAGVMGLAWIWLCCVAVLIWSSNQRHLTCPVALPRERRIASLDSTPCDLVVWLSGLSFRVTRVTLH